MRLKRILIHLAVVCVFLLVVLAGIFLLLQSAAAINRLASVLEPYTGYRVRVDTVSFNRHLDAHIGGLEVKGLRDAGFSLAAEKAEVKGKLDSSLKVEVEKILLTHPRFTFQVKKEKEGPGLFAALEKLPPVRLLVVQDGELRVKTEEGAYALPGVNVTVKNFAPTTGGELKIEGLFNVSSGDTAGAGSFRGAFDMTRFSPDPSGRGSVRLALDTATVGATSMERVVLTSKVGLEGDRLSFENLEATIAALASGKGKERVTADNVTVAGNLAYDQRTSRFSATSLRAASPGLATVSATWEGTVKPFSWLASVDATSVDLPRVFALARPLLPADYRSWKFKGTGAFQVQTQGRIDDRPVWQAEVLLDLKDGGFASADNLKAGEGITGKVQLKLSSPAGGQKGRFNAALDAGEGEFLWGKFYRNFKGEKASLSARGTFTQSPFSLSCTGLLDFFASGDYTFSADVSPDEMRFTVDMRNMIHSRLFSLLLANYVQQNYPDLQGVEVGGHSGLRVSALVTPEKREIEGRFTSQDGAVRISSINFSLQGLQVALPFDLAYPTPGKASPLDGEHGFVSVGHIEGNHFHLEDLKLPLLATKSTLLVPAQVDLTLLGGVARLTHFRMDGLLSPDVRLDAGLALEHLDVAVLTRDLSPIPVNGTIDGSLNSIVAEHGEWKTRGKVVAAVFGGEIEVNHIFGRNLFSQGRSFGGDIRFDRIDLEKITGTLKVGTITGLIRGTIKDFAMEYGQPSHFVLHLETDPTKKAPRKVSVEAIENLSILGTGSTGISTILNSGVNRFFKKYAYSRIGIACTLENDVFRLRGTIHEGGKEYLIRRTLLGGIDVVNQNPDNSISFKDMQERLSRILRPRGEGKNVSQD